MYYNKIKESTHTVMSTMQVLLCALRFEFQIHFYKKTIRSSSYYHTILTLLK